MIFDWLFKRSKKSKNKEAIAPIFIHVPTREDLINEGKTEELELLDQFKKEYKEKLNRKLLVGNISSEDLSKLYLDNQNIILKHIMDNTYRNVDEILASGNIKELLDAKIEYLGLYILSEENSKLYKEIELRYAALSEIKRKSYFIRPVQRRAISNEIDFLYSGLIICKSNDFASNTTCRLYLIWMNQINNLMTNLGAEETKLLNEKKILITKLANTFIKDKYDGVINSNMHDLGIVSYLMIELEKYYLKHKIELEMLDEEIDKLYGQEITLDNKDALLKKIELLEEKHILLILFNNEVRHNLRKLYTIKFNTLTYCLSLFGEQVISKEDMGYDFYNNIVQEKINVILHGNNRNFNDAFSSIDINSKTNVVNDYFVNADETLNNMEKLAVLLSFDRENGFNDLLNNTLIRKNDFQKLNLLLANQDNLDFYKSLFNGNNEYGIEWSDFISLKSVLEMMRRRELCAYSKTLIRLFSCSNLKYSFNQLPDGIIKVTPTDWRNIKWCYVLPNFDKFHYEIKLPMTIKEFNDQNILCYHINTLPLGIKKVTFRFWGTEIRSIPPIPPTVSELEIDSFWKYIMKGDTELTFLDFKNSLFLKSKENLIKMFGSLPKNNINIILENNGVFESIVFAPPLYEEIFYDIFRSKIIIKTGYDILTGETTPCLQKTKNRNC